MTWHLLRTTTAIALVFSLGAPNAIPSAAASPSDVTLAQADEAGKPDEDEKKTKKQTNQGEGAAAGASGEAAGQAKKSTEAEAEAAAEAEGQADVKAEAPGKSGEAPGQEKKAEEGETGQAEAKGEEETAEEAAAAAEAETRVEEDVEEEPAEDGAEGETETGTAAQAEAEANAEASAEEPEPDSTAESESEAEATQAADASETTEDTEPQAAEAAEEGEAAEPVEVTSETVTEENTRTSDEDFEQSVSEASDDDDDDTADLLKILGAAGAGLAVGALLDDGSRVVESTGDRVIVERDGQYFVRKDETEILRRPGSQVRTETFRDGSTRTVVERDNGIRVVTIRDSEGYVVRRTKIMPDGREIVLIDDTRQARYDSRIEQDSLPPIDYSVPRREYVEYSGTDRTALRETLLARPVADIDRRFTLRQVRENRRLRALMPRLDLDSITFDLGSAAISPDQARELDALGRTMEDILAENPNEVFLIEGHTDTVGGRAMNLALSDRRAESVALALTEYYDIPPENLITQGYGEEYLKVERQGPVRANRRATVRRITPLLETARAQ